MQYLKCLPDLNGPHKLMSGRAQHGSLFKWNLTEPCKAVSVAPWVEMVVVYLV